MKRDVSVAFAAAVVIIGGATGCSPTQAFLKPGTLPPGTAALTINGKDLGLETSVQCVQDQWLMTIKTGKEASGVTAMISNARQLTAEFIRIRDLDGFTGSYDRRLQGEAAVTMNGDTYAITGAATGFNDAKPTDRATENFAIRVSC